MKTNPKHISYAEWKSADEIHAASKAWLSELLFIRDEHDFFADLIKVYTPQLIQPKKFGKSKDLIKAISNSQKQNDLLIKAVEAHENALKILVDGVNQIEEEKAYAEKHRVLVQDIDTFLKNYKTLKTRVFKVIKAIKLNKKKMIAKL